MTAAPGPPRASCSHPLPRLRSFGILALTVAALLAPMDSLRVAHLGGMADAALIAGIGVLCWRQLVAPSPVLIAPYVPVIGAATVFLTGGLIGTFFGGSTGASLANAGRFSVAVMGIPLALALARPALRQVRRLAWAFVTGAAISSLASPLTVNPVTGRAEGLGSHPNVLGLSAAFALALLWGLRPGLRPVARRATLVLDAALLYGVSQSGSRAGLVATLVAAGAHLVLRRRTRIVLGALAAGAVLAAAVLAGFWTPGPESAVGRVLGMSESARLANEGRDELAAAVTARIDRHLVTGSGFARATEAHNVLLQVVDVGGLLGLVGFAGMVVGVTRGPLRKRGDPLVVGGLAMYAGYLAVAVIANAIWDRWLWIPIGIMLAAATTFSPYPSPPRGPGPVPGRPKGRGRAAAREQAHVPPDLWAG